jgi:hypothetical protein
VTQPLLALCLATYEAPAALWRAQLASLRRQTWRHWVCLLQDDASQPAAWQRLKASVKGDRRFQVRRNPRRLGFYRNFEAALRRVPAEAAYVAFCDQDDRWDAAKLALTVAELERTGAQLAYCNLRLTNGRGRVLAPSNWIAPVAGRLDLEMLSLANTVAGAASVFRRSLLDTALPFPQGDLPLYHDQWLALNALALGTIAYVPEPLYSYVQHGGNAIGHGAPPARQNAWLRWGRRLRRWTRPSAWQGDLQAAQDFCPALLNRAALLSETLLGRLGPRLTSPKRKELEQVRAASRDLWALARLAGRGWWRGRDIYQIESELLEGQLRLRLQRWAGRGA